MNRNYIRMFHSDICVHACLHVCASVQIYVTSVLMWGFKEFGTVVLLNK